MADSYPCYTAKMLFYENVDELTLLNDAMGAGGIAWWMMEYPGGAVFFHPNKIRMLGYDDKDMDTFVHYTSFTDLLHPDDYPGAMQAMTDHLTGKNELYETEYRIKGKDGKYRIYFDRGKIVAKNKKGEMAIAGMVIDVTKQGFSHKKPVQ